MILDHLDLAAQRKDGGRQNSSRSVSRRAGIAGRRVWRVGVVTLAGDFVKERPCAALAASLHSNRFAWAMTALVMMGAASGPAANAQPANGESSNYCLLVKDAAARARDSSATLSL